MIDKNEFYKYLESLLGISVNDNTIFFEGLGIDGLDAEVFMITLRDKYDVDLDFYDPYLYHSPDNTFGDINPLRYLWWRIFDKSKLKKDSFSALHLYNVVKAGRWLNPL